MNARLAGDATKMRSGPSFVMASPVEATTAKGGRGPAGDTGRSGLSPRGVAAPWWRPLFPVRLLDYIGIGEARAHVDPD